MHTQDDFYQQLKSLQKRFDNMQPELEISVRDTALGVEGFIVVWNTAISRHGPLPNCAKGGTRIRPGLTLAEIKMLARNMAIKNAAAGLPLGGCKSGLNADPNQPDFESTYRRFIQLCKPYTHENGGIFGGFGFDIGAAPEHALWACDTLNSRRSFTGKTVAMGGTDYDREGIAGLGVAEAAVQTLVMHDEDLQRVTFSVHGVGAMGAAVIRYFSASGGRLNAIGDPKFGGTWVFDKPISQALSAALIGLDTDTAKKLLPSEGRLLDNDANRVLFESTDLLFPCALQYVIDSQNADRIQARYIVEGANNPTSLDAYPLLYRNGIQQVPDFIANAGGIIAAYIELTNDNIDQRDVELRTLVHRAKALTSSTIKKNVANIVELSRKYRIPMRDAGIFTALSAILDNEIGNEPG